MFNSFIVKPDTRTPLFASPTPWLSFFFKPRSLKFESCPPSSHQGTAAQSSPFFCHRLKTCLSKPCLPLLTQIVQSPPLGVIDLTNTSPPTSFHFSLRLNVDSQARSSRDLVRASGKCPECKCAVLSVKSSSEDVLFQLLDLSGDYYSGLL